MKKKYIFILFVLYSLLALVFFYNLTIRSVTTLDMLTWLIFVAMGVIGIVYFHLVNRQYLTELYKLSYFDELTQIANFKKFQEDASLLLENNSCQYTIIKLDFDRFRVVNEIYGYENGNKLLVLLVKAIKEFLDPKFDCFARIKNDEFIILYHNDIDKVHSKLINIIKRYKHFHSLGGESLSLVWAYCQIEANEKDISKIYEKVNIAHKIAKSRTDKYCNYNDEIKNTLVFHKKIEDKMIEALESGKFKLYLQPKYLVENGKICGAEALVRWADEYDLLYPQKFIHIFEKNGFIIQLDLYMFEQTCQIIKEMIELGKAPVVISVNFSRLHLSDSHFVQKIINIAKRYGIAHSLLEIELTESIVFSSLDEANTVLNEIHNAGFTLSIDDFGTGYSSLGLLANIPIDVIKLDKSFFDCLNEQSLIVIESIINMAKKLNIKIVAEGIETNRQITMLRILRCDIVQGYYYSKPMPRDEFLGLV